MVTSYVDYQRWFGTTFKDARYMPHAVNGFFENGGKRLYGCRIVGNNSTTATADAGNGFTISAVGPGAWGNRVWFKIQEASTKSGATTGVPPEGGLLGGEGRGRSGV
jgi:hypothetical protein